MSSKGTVICVPGFLGSALLTAPEDTPWYLGPILWVDYARLASGGWRWLQLAPDGRSNALPGARPLRAGGALTPYWGSLLAALADFGWDTEGVLQDWRGTLQDDADRLVGTIASLEHVAPVHLVAHSRGGLVVRQALADLRRSGRLGLVGRVIGLGVPHTGTVEALSVLAGWQRDQLGLTWLVDRYDSFWWPYYRAGGWEAVTASWPALYALMPAPQASWIRPDQARVIYDPASWSAISRNIAPAWLAAARIGWVSLPAPDRAIPWLDVYGDTDVTLVSWRGPGLPKTADASVWEIAGDGIVPTASATWPDHPTIRTLLSHAQLATSWNVARYADEWFRGVAPSPQAQLVNGGPGLLGVPQQDREVTHSVT